MNFRLLERLGVFLLIAAAFVPRARDLAGPFDREFDGFQGSCFAAFCVNYERYGIGFLGGYPTYFVDLPDESRGETLDPSHFVYANHSPLFPLMLWASVSALGPDGWEDAWRDDMPPEGIEFALRIPTFVFHIAGLVAFWWMLRQASGPRVAMLGLAVLTMTPLSIVYAQLVNYENTSLFFVCLAYGFFARRLRGAPGRNLLWCTVFLATSTAITYAPACFLPPLLCLEWSRRGLRNAGKLAGVLVPAALLPVLGHALWVRLALPDNAAQPVFERVEHMLAPLLLGELPFGEWLRRQALRIGWFFSLPIALAAIAGLVWSLARRRRPEEDDSEAAPVDLGPALFAGGFLYLLAFYAHTFDGEGRYDGQTMFLLDLAPGIAACAAFFLERLAGPLDRLRAGIAPLVVVTSMVGILGIARANEIRTRWRAPGPADPSAQVDDGVRRGPSMPLPKTTGEQLRALIPAGAITLYPSALGFNQAPGYYAWRSLLAVEYETFGHRMGLLDLMGLGGRDLFLLLPKEPTAAVTSQVGPVRDQLVAEQSIYAEDERWELWRLAR